MKYDSTKAGIHKLINDYWKFDSNQQPLSSWHDKQELLELIEKLYYNGLDDQDKLWDQVAHMIQHIPEDHLLKILKTNFTIHKTSIPINQSD